VNHQAWLDHSFSKWTKLAVASVVAPSVLVPEPYFSGAINSLR
jgi:hypothetical protein